MVLTQERASILSEFLSADEERAEKLVALEPSSAVLQINALGYDFTLDELNEYGDALRSALAAKGELGVDELDCVAGGDATLTGAIITGACILVAAVITSRAW